MDELILYKIIKTLHIIFVTTWMAGLFYLPRLFVYHSKCELNSSEYRTFLIMEEKLLKFIMNPSLIFSWIFGLTLIFIEEIEKEIWIILKIFCVILISLFHIYCIKIRIDFLKRKNTKKERFFRLINEIPTILFLIIIFLVVFKPMN